MSKVAVDIVIEITADTNDPERSVIRTNARPEALDELLSNWVLDQMFTGADHNPPSERDVYTVKIGLALDEDRFCTESDTGNRALTCGIVMTVLGKLESLQVLPFS